MEDAATVQSGSVKEGERGKKGWDGKVKVQKIQGTGKSGV
jgi:hypothetical protein